MFVLQNDVEISTTDEAQRTELLNEFETTINNSELAHGMQELLGAYLALERYFLEESVNKALGMDTLDPDQQTSSMVDDVFFIVQKCIRYILPDLRINVYYENYNIISLQTSYVKLERRRCLCCRQHGLRHLGRRVCEQIAKQIASGLSSGLSGSGTSVQRSPDKHTAWSSANVGYRMRPSHVLGTVFIKSINSYSLYVRIYSYIYIINIFVIH